MSELESVVPDELADEEIPILDFGPYLAGEEGAFERLVGELRHAQEDVGFYFAINHGVPRALIERTHANIRRFFDLSEEEKRKHRNYVPPRSTLGASSTVNENTKPDLHEMLRVYNPAIVERFPRSPNQWPDENLLPGWKAEMLEYYGAMEGLGAKLLPLYAVALDQPADYFDGNFKFPLWLARHQHYPPVAAEDNQFGIAPHRDHGFITLLPVTDTPGLQVLSQSGRWLPANWVEGAIIINTGEFLNRWTNGRFMATPHRVVVPERDRYSLAFFYSPSWDAVAKPMTTCVGPDNPPRYKPVRFLDYQVWYVNQNYVAERHKAQAEPPTPEESPLGEDPRSFLQSSFSSFFR